MKIPSHIFFESMWIEYAFISPSQINCFVNGLSKIVRDSAKAYYTYLHTLAHNIYIHMGRTRIHNNRVLLRWVLRFYFDMLFYFYLLVVLLLFLFFLLLLSFGCFSLLFILSHIQSETQYTYIYISSTQFHRSKSFTSTPLAAFDQQ